MRINTHRMNRALSLLAVLVILVIQPARAAITLHIDTTAEEIYFSGSDTGTPYTSEGPQYIVDWTGSAPNGGTPAFLEITDAFTSTSGFVTEAFFVFQSEGYYGIGIGLSQDGANTLLTNSTRIAYGEGSGLDSWARDIINNLAANPTPLTINPQSSGYVDMSVDTVPEPSTYALLALGAALLAYRLLRRPRLA